jgi:hypothetical protein
VLDRLGGAGRVAARIFSLIGRWFRSSSFFDEIIALHAPAGPLDRPPCPEKGEIAAD